MTEPLFDPAAPEMIRPSYSDEDPPPPAEWAEEIPPPDVSPLDEPVGDTGFTMADVIEETREVQQRQRSALSIPSMIEADPEKAVRQVEAWTKILPTLQRAAIAATLPSDWVVMKAEGQDEAEASCFPRKGACLQLRRFFGVSILNPRHPETGQPCVKRTDWTDERGEKQARAEILVDGFSERLGERIVAVRGVRSTTEKFVGRADQPQDIEEAARTSAESKAVRVLTGIVSLPAGHVAAIMGMELPVFLSRATKGAGFGSSAQRRGAKQDAVGPASSHAGEFWAHVVALFQGDEARAWAYLAELGSFTGEDGKKVKPGSYQKLAASQGWYRKTLEKFNAAHPDHAFKAE